MLRSRWRVQRFLLWIPYQKCSKFWTCRQVLGDKWNTADRPSSIKTQSHFTKKVIIAALHGVLNTWNYLSGLSRAYYSYDLQSSRETSKNCTEAALNCISSLQQRNKHRESKGGDKKNPPKPHKPKKRGGEERDKTG